jgi:hypothetical protein
MTVRGRPKGVETRVLHVRVPTTLHRDLEILQVITGKTTSDVVRALLDSYVLSNSTVLKSVSESVGKAQRVWTQAEIESQERGQLEADEESSRSENKHSTQH